MIGIFSSMTCPRFGKGQGDGNRRGTSHLSLLVCRARPIRGSKKTPQHNTLNAIAVVKWGLRAWIWTKVCPSGMARGDGTRHGTRKPSETRAKLTSGDPLIPRNRKDFGILKYDLVAVSPGDASCLRKYVCSNQVDLFGSRPNAELPGSKAIGIANLARER